MRPIILIILDGWGINKEQTGNAITHAKTPTINEIEKFYPATSLQASGIAVGLPWGEAGSSEVGHLILGAGRVIYQYLPRIVLAIRDGSFFKNPALIKAIEHAKVNKSCLHLMGLVSSGNVHSYIDHLYGLIELAKRENIEKVLLHVFTDGEDAPSKEAAKFLLDVEEKLNELKNGKIATVMGRYYAMDRNKNWNRTKKAYECLVEGKGIKAKNPIKAIEDSYERGTADTFTEPIVTTNQENQDPLGVIQNNDSIIFFNFRKDRARQLTKAFVLSNFKEFSRKPLKNLCFVTMTQYEKELPVRIAFSPTEIKNHLTEFLSGANKKILKLAETEKYAHVTYFFNGGEETAYPGETQFLVPSTTIPHYDKYPEMAATEITDKIIKDLGKYDLVVANYANTDMVAHTGNFQAAIKAAEILDGCLKSLIKLVSEKKYCLLITADHGNAEKMINPQTGESIPEHSTSPVPCYLITPENKREKSKSELEVLYQQPQGILADIAPTILELMEIPQPPEMTGQSLLDILK